MRTPDAVHPSPVTGGRRVADSLRELPVLLLVALLLAFLLRTFVVQVFYIPSGSMEPTLSVDDRIAVEKLTYQLRDPRRGEIVVFAGDSKSAPANAAPPIIGAVGQFLGVVPVDAEDLVKRVIGVPGDVVTIDDGAVSINGEPLDEPYVQRPDAGTFGPFSVPDGELFVLGDNRADSSDSRYPSLGYVPIARVVGRVAATIWPPGHLAGSEAAQASSGRGRTTEPLTGHQMSVEGDADGGSR